MRVDRLIKLNDNLNRIKEMREAGIGIHCQVGAFKDHGVHITAEQLITISEVMDELSSKALPKKAVKIAIMAANVMKKAYPGEEPLRDIEAEEDED